MAEKATLKLTGMAHGGEALGRWGDRTLFVPYAIPGERVLVEIVEEHQRYAHTRLLEVLEPSPARQTPPCPYFGAEGCGGCQWQHITYPVQVSLKGRVMVDQLQRIGKLAEPPVLEPLADDQGWEYRNHSRFRLTPAGRPGFLSANSHHVIPVDDCLILHPLLSNLLASLELTLPELEWLELRAGTATGDLMLVLQTVDDEPPELAVDFPLSIVQVRHDGAVLPLIGLDYITEVVHGREFRISATSFYQVNSAQAERLVDLVLAALELQGDEQVVDAYCGIGLFTAFLSERAARVTGIELSEEASADARYNLAGSENVEWLTGPVELLLGTVAHPVDAIVLDPPREGLERRALDALAAHRPARIAYVSCDPATLARDTRRLTEAGYTLAWVQPVDLFPQTYHLENVALFTR